MKKIMMTLVVVASLTGTALFAEETHSLTEWIQRLKKAAATESVDPEFARLREGCAYAAILDLGGDGRSLLSEVPGVQEEKEHFKAWMSTGAGATLQKKWLKGEPLDEMEKTYLPFVKLSTLWRSKYERYESRKKGYTPHPLRAEIDAYYKKTDALRKTIYPKAFRGEPLTRADIEQIQECLFYYVVQNTGAGPLPHEILCSKPQLAQTNPHHKEGGTIGANAPDFQLPTIKTVMARSGFDLQAYPEPARFITDDGLADYLAFFLNYQADEHSNDIAPTPFTIRDGDDESGYVRLSSFEGKKIVVLQVLRMADGCIYSYTHRRFRFPEALRQAYQGQVEFITVNSSYHDMSAGVPEYFGEKAGKRQLSLFPHTQEDMAREAARILMELPNMGGTILVDDDGCKVRDMFRSSAGGTQTFIIDIDGKLAWMVHGARRYEHYLQGAEWANEIERQLTRMLANEGRYLPEQTYMPKGDMFKEVFARLSDPVQNKLPVLLENLTIQKIDATNHRLHVKGKDATVYTVDVTPKTRIQIGAYRHESDDVIIQPATMDSFNVGDRLRVSFPAEGYTLNGKSTVSRTDVKADTIRIKGVSPDQPIIANMIHITKNLPSEDARTRQRKAWVTGSIQSVKDGVVSVTIQPPPLDELVGYQIWQKENAVAWGRAEERLEDLANWTALSQAKQPATFRMDAFSNLFLNGEEATAEELQSDDFVAIQYRFLQFGEKVVTAVEVRATRLDTKTPLNQ